MIQKTTDDDSHLRQGDGWLSRERSLALVLIVASGIVGYLCYRLILPFLPALAWALALAVMAHPLHSWIKRRVSHTNIAAGLTVLIVVILIAAPAVFVTQRLAGEATNATRLIQETLMSGQWRTVFERNPRLRPLEAWIESQFSLEPRESDVDESDGSTDSAETTTEDEAIASADESIPITDETDQQTTAENETTESVAQVERAAGMLSKGLGTLVTGTGWLLMQFLVTFMSLFFFFRDRYRVLAGLRSLLPLTNSETDKVFSRVSDTIHSTIFGSVVVAMVQGSMGGLMFWWLGLPSPLLWGAVMSILAVVPMLGTFVIWAPTAVFLFIQGEWISALILVAWGALAIGTIDNFLYPTLVGQRMRLHTLLVFFAIVGGILLFGASGVILGPLLLASADALLEIWRRRTAYGGSMEECSEQNSPQATGKQNVRPTDGIDLVPASGNI